ncbi:ABC transporter substrate-binding protein [Microlunatus endophyticus]|uniref:ABC transporter substrate-binding protein n=1 Tax=Microlunatus endophyticus TaxID=1716077 RepID=A0A917SB37_9ACTN|nr:ABC transporter substrate-binding protein [Microlunatus endophyticus]GGL69308.1 ABC transporter substrate-binding protein [Microlunatus endophyticus]
MALPFDRRIDRRALLAGGLATAAVAGVGLTACGPTNSGSQSDASATGGTLSIAMSAANIPFPSTPPNQGYEGYRFVGNNIYDALTRLNLDQDKTLPVPHPSLAEKWDVSEDLKTWTFTLRKGVTFHDGTAFNADAVIFQLDRLKNEKFKYFSETDAANGATQVRYIDKYEAVDDSTVKITCTQPYAWLHWDLLHVYMPSPAVIKKVGNDKYNAHATGTGPFKMTKYVDGETMELTRYDKWWPGPVKLDKIVLYPQPEAASRLSMLQSGQVNWAEVPTPDSIDQLKADGDQIFMHKYPHGIMPRFNLFRKPFKGNTKLRQALNYALDRDGCAALINNVGYGAKQYVYEGHPDYAPNNPGYSYDVAKAKQLLSESGYQPGELTITMGYTTGGSGNMFPDVMMQKLQADFKAIGVATKLVPMEWTVLISIGLDGLNSDKWKNLDILWASPAAGMTPTGYNSTFMSKRPGGQANATGLDDPVIDKNLTLAPQQKEEKDQHAYLQKMMDQAVSQAYFLFWMHDLNLRVMSADVKNFVEPQSWWVDFSKITVSGS